MAHATAVGVPVGPVLIVRSTLAPLHLATASVVAVIVLHEGGALVPLVVVMEGRVWVVTRVVASCGAHPPSVVVATRALRASRTALAKVVIVVT